MNNNFKHTLIIGMSALCFACKAPTIVEKEALNQIPSQFGAVADSTNSADVKWREYFHDPYLAELIDSALSNNQELNITLQEIRKSGNEVLSKEGEYMPFVNVGGAAGVDKVGRYTNIGASEANTDIRPGQATPEPLPDFKVSAFASWELDIWNKLRNAKDAAFNRYIASVEGKNFMVTNLIAEIADSYYELLALDNQLLIVNQNIEIQSNALRVVRFEKEATRTTELAVKRFEAEVLKTKSLQYDIQQRIILTENKINFLVGRFPQTITRNSNNFNNMAPDAIYEGIPSQLMQNRPDIRQAEQELAAAKLDVLAARAAFYPALKLSATAGLQAFNPIYLATIPQSLLASLTGDIVGPLINRNAIAATYYNANATQIAAVYNYERTILNAYIEVVNQISSIDNLSKSYALRAQQAQALTESIDISTRLFANARADYMEVLLTQRDALESKFDLIEIKKQQFNAWINAYKALGGGWK